MEWIPLMLFVGVMLLIRITHELVRIRESLERDKAVGE